MTTGTMRVAASGLAVVEPRARSGARPGALGALLTEIAEVLAGSILDPLREGLAGGRRGAGLESLTRDVLADLGIER